MYDLKTDPQESYNRKDDHPEVIETLKRTFLQWEAEMKANPGGWKEKSTKQ